MALAPMKDARRILSLWLPRFAAEWRLRRMGGALGEAPFAVVAETANALTLHSVDAAAEAAGLAPGMGLSDARAMQPDLITRPAAPEREDAALAALARWAGRWSPFTATDGADGLILDVSGCAHLFGGEAALTAEATAALADLGFTARAALADTRGAAWALARYAPTGGGAPTDGGAPTGTGAQAGAPGALSGDAIAPDAHATRVRTPKRRRWTRPMAAPERTGGGMGAVIAPIGGARAALAPLPVAALRLPDDVVARLQRLGLRRIEELMLTPRAGLARRFGIETPHRLDQALGMTPEPVSPRRQDAPLAARIAFPEPVGLAADIEAATLKLAQRLAERLADRGLGARRLRLALRRADGGTEQAEIGLARPGRDPERIAALFAPKIAALDADFGVDAARLSIIAAEPLAPAQHRGHMEARADADARLAPGGGEAFADLLSRIGGRIGLERITRPLPAESHIPEKAWVVAAAAYCAPPPGGWPARGRLRPPVMLAPEPAEVTGRPPARLRWRGRALTVTAAAGPERIAPEWWLDDPAWRSGPRDYWRVEDEEGRRLWLFEAKGGERPGGWFVQGEMA